MVKILNKCALTITYTLLVACVPRIVLNMTFKIPIYEYPCKCFVYFQYKHMYTYDVVVYMYLIYYQITSTITNSFTFQ